jgi:hypothetical protein
MAAAAWPALMGGAAAPGSVFLSVGKSDAHDMATPRNTAKTTMRSIIRYPQQQIPNAGEIANQNRTAMEYKSRLQPTISGDTASSV